MAIIVDKVQKKRDIALSCKKLFVKHGIKDLTISEIAKSAGIGKGTIYEYFKNKEEIVFEIVNILMQKHSEQLLVEIDNIKSTKDKIKKFSEFFYNEDDYELREIYKEFISITLINPNDEMVDFQTQCNESYYDWFKKIIQDGVDKHELIPESIELSRGIFVMGKGMFIISRTTTTVDDLKYELDIFIDTIFKLIEVKKLGTKVPCKEALNAES